MPTRTRRAVCAPSGHQFSVQQPVTCSSLVCSWPTPARHLVLAPPRCRATGASDSHPDWPRNPERFAGLRDEDIIELEQFLKVYQTRQQEAEEGPGEVYLVGTGPGDPGLLTLRALQLMQTADVVLYDRLVSDDILRLVGPQARMVYVGKHSGFHTRSQDEIHSLLLAFAEAGATVIRLKGGDPYVFGRGGEEVQYLAARGIEVHCVPGITAASGICAELGVPMTHRGVATSVRFLTGHARDGDEQELLDSTVAGAADPHTTLVVYMGLQTLPTLYAALSTHGMPSDVPAVAVERGTTRRQRVAWGTVGELPQRAIAAGLKSPTLIIIGQVVALAPGWQQWQAAGRPVTSTNRLPRHGYALPQLDTEQLKQAQAAAQATARTAPAASVVSGEGIRTREVLAPTPATEAGRAAMATATAAAAATPVLAPKARPGVPEPPQVQQRHHAVKEKHMQESFSHAGRQEAESVVAGDGNCGGEDEACPLPLPAASKPARPECGEDEACPLFL